MNDFALELTGAPAAIIILSLLGIAFYVIIYLPMKLLISGAAHARKKADKYELLKQRTVVAEYDPPASLTPAEIGFLYDTKLNMDEVFGTIVSLEQQGFVTLIDNHNLLQISDVKQASANLKAFEKYILGYLGEHKGQVIKASMLKTMARQGELIIKRQLREQDYLVPQNEQIKRSFLRVGYIWLVLIIFTALLFRPNSWSEFGGFMFGIIFFFPAYAILSVILYGKFQRIAGEPWLATPQLKEIWSDIEGYYQFIKLVELDNLQFESKNTEGIVRNKVLPYAIALGFNTGWDEYI